MVGLHYLIHLIGDFHDFSLTGESAQSAIDNAKRIGQPLFAQLPHG